MSAQTPLQIQATEVLALLLANTAANYLDPGNRPIDDRTYKAKLDGAAAAAHALGFGRTPVEVSLTALDYVRDHPRPTGGAFPTDRKVWDVEVRLNLRAALDALV